MHRRILQILAAFSAIAALLVAIPGPAGAEVDGRSPERVLDTRLGIGAPVGRIQPGDVLRLTIPAVTPAADTSVLLNLTAAGPSGIGFVTAWSCADPMPTTSILNFEPGRAVPNAAVLGYTGEGICLSVSAPVHLLADLTGVVTGGDVATTRQARVVDTRSGSRLTAGREYRYRIAGRGNVPSGASAAMLNVTVHRPSADGFVLVAPCDDSTASTMNFRANENVAHFTYADLDGGDVCVTSSVATGLIIDTFGSIPSSSPLQVVSPDRVVDTRNGIGGRRGQLRDGDTLRFRVAGYAGVPNGADAAAVNVVAVNASDTGFLSLTPCDGSGTSTSIVNLWPGALRANQGTVELSASGELCVIASIRGTSGVHVVVDAVGYVEGDVPRPTAPPTTPPPTTVPSGKFETLPAGASLPSGAECAARVRPAAEIRPENSAQNATRGSRATANTRSDWSGFSRVDGDFSGTTDEIIQWAACKWGIDEDIARAQLIKESYWYMSAVGDGGESFGIGQVRETYHQSAFQYAAANARNSTAYNVDYTYAVWRACMEGVYGWLNNEPRGRDYSGNDTWGCVGLWFTGRWYLGDDAYLNAPGDSVRWHYENRTWEQDFFVNHNP